jgi:hypothetical protein
MAAVRRLKSWTGDLRGFKDPKYNNYALISINKKG